MSLGIFSALAAFVWASFSIAFAQESIVVEGQLVNGTSNGEGVEGITVTFHHESPTVHTHMEGVTDSGGRFRFEEVEFDPMAVYGVSVRYQNALYGSDIDLSEGSPPPAAITVFDSVSDQEILSGGSSSLLFAAADKASQVVGALEIVRIINNSDYTYVPGTDQPMNLLRFGLPPGSRGLSVDTRLIGADFVQVDRGFALLSSIPPGSHEIMFTYEFPYDANDYTFTKNYRYGADNLRILAPAEVLDISSAELGDTESITIGETAYRIIQVDDLREGTEIAVELSGLPKSSLIDKVGQVMEGARLEYVVAAGLGVFMAIVFAIALWRRRRNESLDETDTAQVSKTLRQMIAELESDFKDGNIDEDDYRRRRRVLESRLLSVVGK